MSITLVGLKLVGLAWWSWEVVKFYSVKMLSLVSIRDCWESLSNNDLNYLIVCLFLSFTTFANYIILFGTTIVWVLKILSIIKLLSLFTSRHFLYFPPEKRIVYDIYHCMLVSSNSQSLLIQRKGKQRKYFKNNFHIEIFSFIYKYIQLFSFILKYFLSNSSLNWTFIH